MQQPPQPVFFKHQARSDGYPNSERRLQSVQARSNWELPRKGGHGGAKADRQHRDSGVLHRGAGGHAQLSWTKRPGGETPLDRRNRQNRITSPDPGLDDHVGRGRRKTSRLQEQQELAARENPDDPCCRAPPGWPRVHEGGFPPRFPFSQLGDFYVNIIPKTRHQIHT